MTYVDNIVFIDTVRGTPDRGWNCDDAMAVLDRHRISSRSIRVESASDLEGLVSASGTALYWPLSFTFDTNPASLTVASTLERLSRPYIGCNATSGLLTSKLRFKDALLNAGLPAPGYRTVRTGNEVEVARYPAFLKAEFSCDSLGVRLVRGATHAQIALQELSTTFHHGFYLEEVAGTAEWTVACIVLPTGCLTSSLRLEAVAADYIDAAAKTDNALLRLSVPQPHEARILSAFAADMTNRLGLSGYFRVDVFTRDAGPVMPIDLNLLPHLNCAPGHLSYLPTAFMLETGCSYDEVLAAVIATAIHEGCRPTPGSPLDQFLSSSRLFANASLFGGDDSV